MIQEISQGFTPIGRRKLGGERRSREGRKRYGKEEKDLRRVFDGKDFLSPRAKRGMPEEEPPEILEVDLSKIEIPSEARLEID